MVKSIRVMKLSGIAIALFLFLTVSVPVMSYEEPQYEIIKKTEIYEVRQYDQRTVARVTYGEEDSGFRILFDYISGENQGSTDVKMTVPVTQSTDINMTAPVTQSNAGDKMVMQFFLPRQYIKATAPKPTNPRVKIIDLPQSYFAVIAYPGFASNGNFEKHHQTLKAALDADGISISGPPMKASYNSPFTLPFLRRNEAMYPLAWN